jgi:hypothetical protein
MARRFLPTLLLLALLALGVVLGWALCRDRARTEATRAEAQLREEVQRLRTERGVLIEQMRQREVVINDLERRLRALGRFPLPSDQR